MMRNLKILHIAIGVIINPLSQVLVALRSAHAEQGGLWEFPGGKIEKGETPLQALTRELQEEVGIIVEQATPLLQLEHVYPNKKVCLEVWRVEKFSGIPYVKENQLMLRWVTLSELKKYNIPAANHLIIDNLFNASSCEFLSE